LTVWLWGNALGLDQTISACNQIIPPGHPLVWNM